ncbi:MAG: DUF3365 domain-containing protein [Planctomycetaceae bacterium]|nr:MAG: DUF3365 domain-containing protein [Planctomycetaceae bacterium]
MNRATRCLMLCHFVLIAWLPVVAREPPAEPPTAPAAEDAFPPAGSVVEARSRARLLHETIHGTLQVMHRDFFDKNDAHAIPSASLEDVFHELSKDYQVELKWLIVDTDVVNVDHQPVDDFERSAVRGLKSGQRYVEATETDRYRFAGPIRLASQCLSCHVKDRTSNQDRTAGLLITMPLVLAPE